MILGWRRPGKVDQRRHLYSSLAQSVEHSAVNRVVARSSRAGGAKSLLSFMDRGLYYLFGIFDSLAYEYYDWDEVSKGKHYNSISVGKRESSIDDESLIIYIYNTFDPKESIQFNWIGEKLNLIILIENISECEDMVLEILFEYLKFHPDDIFYNEMEWYYTKRDIDEIYLKPSKKDWCYHVNGSKQ